MISLLIMDTSSLEKNKQPTNPGELSKKVARVKRRKDKRSRFFLRLKRRTLKHLWLVRAGIVAGIILGVYVLLVLFSSTLRHTGLGNYIGFVSDFIFTPSEKIESISGRTNILVLGKGGKGHEAPDLTDTIIFASVKHSTTPALRGASDASVTLVSLSRDIWIPEIRAKLNSTYYWGNQKKPPVQGPSGPEEGGGLILSSATVEKIVGAPVHYGVVVDFSGFKRIIDELGGIEVEVKRSFVDSKYPIPGREDDECDGNDPEFLCRYETISFETGRQLMDGETALKYARSRNAEGDEGTDFARAERQQKVIEAVRETALGRAVLLKPRKILNVLRVAQESVETDIDTRAFAILARRILDARDNVVSKVLPEQFLINPPISRRYDNQYVFIPKDDTWTEVQKWVKCVLENNGECD